MVLLLGSFDFNGGGAVGPRLRGGLWMVIASLALTACPAPRPEQPKASPRLPLTIMPLGDSITHGYNVPGGYRRPLWQALSDRGYRAHFVGSQRHGPPDWPEPAHEGHSGWKIEQIHQRVPGWLAQAQPEIILLLLGTNDMAQGDRLATAPERLAALLETIYRQNPAVQVFVASIPPIADPALNRRVQAYNAALPAIVAQQQARGQAAQFVDVYAVLTGDDLADGVHPNLDGHEKIAAAWLEALLAALPAP